MDNRFDNYFKRNIQTQLHYDYRTVCFQDLPDERLIEMTESEDVWNNPSLSIKKAIIEVKSEYLNNRVHLRSDAEYFLISNFKFMIYRPLYEVNRPNRSVIIRDIYEDVKMILKLCYETAISNHAAEISSHLVMENALTLWDNLKSTSKDSW